MDTLSTQIVSLIAASGIAVGYAIFAIIRYVLPKRLRSTHEQQRELVIQKANHRREQIVAEGKKRAEERVGILREELEVTLVEERLAIEATEADLVMQEQFAQHEEERIQKLEVAFQAQSRKVEDYKEHLDQIKKAHLLALSKVQDQLAVIADVDKDTATRSISENFVHERQLDSQRRIKELVDDLESHSKKSAERVLSRLLSRYQPTFVWPKSVNHVEIASPKLFDLLTTESQLLDDLRQLTEGVEITLTEASPEGAPPVVRLGGGYGIFKEAARLTLEELLPRGPSQWSRADKTYAKHRKNLEIQALKLGRLATAELKLNNIHEEIQRMVGALNWRTSYRQNQYFHSVEVARLAGILAGEMGVDPDLAKRCGLLHDIGKGIDYRIEGSHAVISGDYADRFGEKRLVCDTVMSHHNDLVLDTPLSYILKSADTLSGARPGARINLEEGYQERLAAMEEAIKSFQGIQKVAIMNGGREVHISVNHKRIREEDLQEFCAAIARKIEQDVAFPGQIKVLVTRRFEASAVA